jgi:hypothetical protein
MGFLVSPGVEVKELDLTNVIPALSTSIGGYTGKFNWGPVGKLITVSSENDLTEVFGKPDGTHQGSVLQAGAFLKYGNTLKISRAVQPLTTGLTTIQTTETITASVGTSTSADLTTTTGRMLILNEDDFEANGLNAGVVAAARCPGSYGNSLKVLIARGSTSRTTTNDSPATIGSGKHGANLMETNFDAAPGSVAVTSDATSGTEDEIQVLVVDEDGLLSGTKNNVLEKFQGLSLCSDAKTDDGSSLYYYDVINNTSQYIFINKLGAAEGGLYTNADKTVAEVEAGTNDIADILSADDIAAGGTFQNGLYQKSFTLGQDGTPNKDAYKTALDFFADVDTVDVNLLYAESGQFNDSGDVFKQDLDTDVATLAFTRKDCVAFISQPSNASGNAVEKETTEANKLAKITDGSAGYADKIVTALGNTIGSYAVVDSTPVYVYNKYADNYVYIPAAGHIAGLCAATDASNDPWFSPAGFNRGNLRGVIKLAFNPNQSSRDSLYKANVNPLVTFPGQGTILFGDKTAQPKASAFDRINVRRLFITLEKAISTAAKFSLFELNDEFTRAQFRNLVEPFLRDVKGRRGVTDFLVVCDETNNTGQVIDTNRFVADIFIKPARSINFITLNFVATRTGVEFNEIAGA